MSVSVETPCLDLVGRPVLHDGVWTTVTAVEGEDVVLAVGGGMTARGVGVVALPVIGEFVVARSGRGEIRGCWLGLVDDAGHHHGQVHEIDVFVLCGTTVRRVAVVPGSVDARAVVQGRVADGELAALGALLGEARAHGRTRHEQDERLARLVEAAHEEADDRGWCGDFDDFMEAQGLPRRTRDHNLRIEVRATVYLTRSSNTGVDGAINGLTQEDIWDALAIDDIGWEAEADD